MKDEIVERIAVALERQVEQHEESVTRNVTYRDENIRRHLTERDQELSESRRINESFLDQIKALAKRLERYDQAFDDIRDRILAIESAMSVDAVDPVGEKVTG